MYCNIVHNNNNNNKKKKKKEFAITGVAFSKMSVSICIVSVILRYLQVES